MRLIKPVLPNWISAASEACTYRLDSLIVAHWMFFKHQRKRHFVERKRSAGYGGKEEDSKDIFKSEEREMHPSLFTLWTLHAFVI